MGRKQNNLYRRSDISEINNHNTQGQGGNRRGLSIVVEVAVVGVIIVVVIVVDGGIFQLQPALYE